MALDGIFLYSIMTELRKDLIGAKIDKVNQPEKDEITLTIRGSGFTKKLLISASSTFPRIHFTNMNKSNPMKAPMFCMVLRKYLVGAKIIQLRQLNCDRHIIMDFESTDEIGFHSIYSLIIEIMGRHSNITLVRQRDNLIMDSIKHITPDINSYRSLYSGITYVAPPLSLKLDPLNFKELDLKTFIVTNNIELKDTMFSQIFNGVGKPLSKELYNKIELENFTVNDSNIKLIYDELTEVLRLIKNENYKFTAYAIGTTLKDFYCIELTIMNLYEQIFYDSASELLENYYYAKDRSDRLNSKSADLQKLINTNIDRCNKKSEILVKTLEECNEKDLYKINGELLTANIYNIKKGDSLARVQNYYSENTEDYIDINLDKTKSPSENIQYYYKKYNKYKKSEMAAHEQLQFNNDELQYLQSVLTNIRNCDTYDEIEEIRNELLTTGYIRFKKEYKSNKSKLPKPLHFLSSDDIDIYVGKNNIQNDYLTFKIGDKNDIWLHTKNIPGSHVIIKCFGNPPETTLGEAAILAAYYSKAKDSTKVSVDYTQIKNVKKPSGAKPGMVIYYTNKTILVDPYDLKLKKV